MVFIRKFPTNAFEGAIRKFPTDAFEGAKVEKMVRKPQFLKYFPTICSSPNDSDKLYKPIQMVHSISVDGKFVNSLVPSRAGNGADRAGHVSGFVVFYPCSAVNSQTLRFFQYFNKEESVAIL